jgi:hypothetical protein
MELLTSWFTPVRLWKKKIAVAKNAHFAVIGQEDGTHPKVVLPTLTGIMTSRSSDGSTRRLALLDGRICAQGDATRRFYSEADCPWGRLFGQG